MPRFGMPELIIVMIALIWVVSIAAAVWALLTLRQLRVSNDAMRATLERIEQQLRAR